MTRRLILLLSAVFVPRTSQHRCILPASPSPTCVVCVPPISACLASRTCFHLAQLQPKLPNIYLFVTLTRNGSMYSSVPRWADVVWFMETPYLRGIATWFQVRIHTIRVLADLHPRSLRSRGTKAQKKWPQARSLYTALFVRVSSVHSRV
ncbi:hypothetical protein C8F04DRAFT_1098483 [Mycena alexandri]|uniref:Secreted protein n=1 Tax=Mycena alexandri TaxID=1745969 RepID=A0AAD6SWQ6_9AGAR|nr:hypothetical protein C8F04DRAFT_1098483 [Mycena alexandri]